MVPSKASSRDAATLAGQHPAPESDGRMLHAGCGDARMAVPCIVSCPEQRPVAFLPPLTALEWSCGEQSPAGNSSSFSLTFPS